MEIVKENFKYKCDTCGKLFNWDENSWCYGKAEYETLSEQQQKQKTFCSDDCMIEYKTKFLN
jgi:DNA-directed RNA polymerase subunit RPC12/RpoP